MRVILDYDEDMTLSTWAALAEVGGATLGEVAEWGADAAALEIAGAWFKASRRLGMLSVSTKADAVPDLAEALVAFARSIAPLLGSTRISVDIPGWPDSVPL